MLSNSNKKGGDKMNKNMASLLDVLLQQDDYITATQLADILGVTERSVRNYVRNLNGGTANSLIISSNEGYRIQKEPYNDALKSGLLGKEDNLLFVLAFNLMNVREYTSFDKLARQVNYSPEGIRKKVQELFKKITESNLKLKIDSKIFTGIRIEGEEGQKRLLLELLLPLNQITKENITKSLQDLVENLFTQSDIRTESDVLDKVFSSKNVSMDFMVYVKILCHVLILKRRWINGERIVELKADKTIKKYAEYMVAEELLSAQPIVIKDQAEIEALASYLLALPINIPNQYAIPTEEGKKRKISNALKQVEQYYKLPIYSNDNYYRQISNHIFRLLYPLNESIPIFNPYSRETKREYFYAYSIACYLYALLKEDLDIKIPDSEVAYLAMRIQLILLEIEEKAVNALLIYKGKSAEAELFRYKLKTRFPNLEVKTLTYIPIEKELSDYQLIIEVGEAQTLQGNNVVHVTRSLESQNIIEIQKTIDLIGTNHLIENMDYYHMNVKDSGAAIKYLLKKSGYQNLCPYFLERESMSSTDIGNRVALPHPFLKGSETSSKVIVGINSHEILWGTQKVRLIIMYIPDANLKVDEAFFNEVYQKTKNIGYINKLIDTSSKEEFIKIWNEKKG